MSECRWCLARLESVHAEHEAVVAHGAGNRLEERVLACIASCAVRRVLSAAEQLSAQLEFLRPMTVCEKAVVTDADKALGQDVHQESPQELGGSQSHHPPPATVSVVLPQKRDVPVAQETGRWLDIAVR